MTKPSKTKKSTTRSPRKAKPKAATPAAKVEPAVEPQAPPVNDEQVAPETIPTTDHVSEGEPEVAAPQSDAPIVADEPTEPEPAPEASSAGEATVELGGVSCPARFMPLDVVLGVLSEESLERVARSANTDTTDAECKLMLATDGRATPAIFSLPEDDGAPSILHGYETLAAAKSLGRNAVFVIMVPARVVEAAQANIVEMVLKRNSVAPDEDEDDLVRHVYAHYQEA